MYARIFMSSAPLIIFVLMGTGLMLSKYEANNHTLLTMKNDFPERKRLFNKGGPGQGQYLQQVIYENSTLHLRRIAGSFLLGNDLDMDKDGILNAVESPECFYSEDEARDLNSITVISDFTWHTSLGLSNTHDGDVATVGQLSGRVGGISGMSLFEFELPVQQSSIVAKLDLNVGTRLSSSTSGRWRLEGWNGSDWVPLSNPQHMNTSNTIYQFENTNQSNTAYPRYRIAGTGGSSLDNGRLNEVTIYYRNYRASLHPKMNCIDPFDDGDDIPPYLDLDSDGDGCSDSYEAGVIPVERANHSFVAVLEDSNGDGLHEGDGVDPDGDGNPNYVYLPYAYSAFNNRCANRDNDGQFDIEDIDDDNDGILDAVESPTCFYSRAEVQNIISISTDIPTLENGNIEYAIDGNPNSFSLLQEDAGAVGDEIFRITPNRPIKLGHLEYEPTLYGITSGSDRVKLQGFNGQSWLDLTNNISLASTSGLSRISNTLAPEEYFSMFRLVITAASNYRAGIKEIRVVANDFQSSLYPKSRCVDPFADGDDIPPHLDLDSDGDGCSDSYEAGVISREVPNHSFDDVIVDINGDGLHDEDGVDPDRDGVPNYQYLSYAYNAALNYCADDDEDGLSDLQDLDHDKDGILNSDEGACIDSKILFDFNGGSIEGWKHFESEGGKDLAIHSSLYEYISACSDFFPSPSGTHFVGAYDIGALLAVFQSPDDLNLNMSGTLGQTFSYYWINGRVGETAPGGQTLENSQIEIILKGGNRTAKTVYDAFGLVNIGWQLIEIELTVENFGENLPVVLADLDQITIQIETISQALGHECSEGVEYFGIDDIKISCDKDSYIDTDRDGIPDYLDLDSDGDGCPDAIEGSGGIEFSDLVDVQLDGGNTGTNFNGTYPYPVKLALENIDADRNGVPDKINEGQGVGGSRDTSVNLCPTTIDFGDLPVSYGVAMNYNGLDANMDFIPDEEASVWAGNVISYEKFSFHSSDALGDQMGDDGLSGFPSGTLTAGDVFELSLLVNSNQSNIIYFGLWIDWNGDGDFSDTLDGFYDQTKERQAFMVTDGSGTVSNEIPIIVPEGMQDGISNIFYRLRVDTLPLLRNDFEGLRMNGETEDFSQEIVLPLDLLQFFAIPKDDHVYIQWQVAEGGIIGHFDVEYSLNGVEFSKLHSMYSDARTTYAVYHHDVSKLKIRNLYYRIKFIDSGGKIWYSKTEKVELNFKELYLYPNPVDQGAWIWVENMDQYLHNGYYQVERIDGRVMLKGVFSDNAKFGINTTELEPGIYLLNLNGNLRIRFIVL